MTDEQPKPKPLKIFTTDQLLKLPHSYLNTAEKNILKKNIQTFQLKRLSGQLKSNTDYCIRIKMFRCWCIFRVLDSHYQPKNYNVLSIECIEAIDLRSIKDFEKLFRLSDFEGRVYIH